MPGAASAPSMMPEHVCRCCQTPAEGKTPVTENRSLRARARGHTRGRGGPGCQDCGELGTLSRVEGPVLPDPISTPLCFQKNLKPGSECELILILKTGLDRANLAGGPCPPTPHTQVPSLNPERTPGSRLPASSSPGAKPVGALEKQFCSCSWGFFSTIPRVLRPCDPCVVGEDEEGRPSPGNFRTCQGTRLWARPLGLAVT